LQPAFNEPQILVLDEPSAGLDPRARRTLINLLRELPITMLVSTHDMRLVEELFPRTIVMDEGVIVADGENKRYSGRCQAAGSAWVGETVMQSPS